MKPFLKLFHLRFHNTILTRLGLKQSFVLRQDSLLAGKILDIRKRKKVLGEKIDELLTGRIFLVLIHRFQIIVLDDWKCRG